MESSDIIPKLLENNANWAQGMGETFFKNSAGKKQEPQVLWIGCSDSRVPESVITKSRPGDIFVHRNIANQVHLDDDTMVSVVEYAVRDLKVKHVILVGHSECGGVEHCVKEVLRKSQAEPPMDAFHRWLAPLTKLARDNHLSTNPITLPILVKKNVEQQVENLKSMQVIKDANVRVHGWIYNLSTGILERQP